jgi:hypothetical protein
VDPSLSKHGITAIVAGTVFANLAWQGIDVPPEVIVADTAALGLLVEGVTRFTTWLSLRKYVGS